MHSFGLGLGIAGLSRDLSSIIFPLLCKLSNWANLGQGGANQDITQDSISGQKS